MIAAYSERSQQVHGLPARCERIEYTNLFPMTKSTVETESSRQARASVNNSICVGDSLYVFAKSAVWKCRRARGDDMHVWMIIGGVVVAGVAVLTVVMIPDIVRYVKIKSM
jgi:hypothetical protein